jgi:hypothetical protein
MMFKSKMWRKLVILLVTLQQFLRNRGQNLDVRSIFFCLFEFSQDILEHLRFSVVFLLDDLKGPQRILSNVQGLAHIQVFFPALFLEVAPFCLDTFFELLGQSQNIHPDIVVATVGDE